MPVTEQQLLQGAWFAMEQAGLLLQDAVERYDAGRFGTALGLAMLSLEECGKASILLGLSEKVEKGVILSEQQLNQALDDHVQKQTMASAGIVMFQAGPPGSAIAGIGPRMTGPNPESAAALDELTEVAKRKAKRVPSDRHAARLRAFYVDPDGTGGWKRPATIQKADVGMEIMFVVLEYAGWRSAFLNEVPYHGSQERPELPPVAAPTSGLD